MAEQEPLPDPVVYARELTDAELKQYRQIYGEQSREWVIAQRELDRRDGLVDFRELPLVMHFLAFCGLAVLLYVWLA